MIHQAIHFATKAHEGQVRKVRLFSPLLKEDMKIRNGTTKA